MKTREIALFCILFAAIIIGLSIFALYYTSEIKEEIKFKGDIDYSDIVIDRFTDDGINNAQFPIGQIVLENKGLIGKRHKLPYLVGCIKGNFTHTLKYNYKLTADYIDSKDSSFILETHPYSSDYPYVDISVGDERSFDILLKTSVQLPRELYEERLIYAIEVYEDEIKAGNPLSEDFFDWADRFSCGNPPDDDKIATISIR